MTGAFVDAMTFLACFVAGALVYEWSGATKAELRVQLLLMALCILCLTLLFMLEADEVFADAPPVVEVEVTDTDGVHEYRPEPGSPDYDPADYGLTTATVADVVDVGPAPLVVERAPLRLWLVGGVS